MNTYKIKVELEVEIDAEKSSDATAAIYKAFGISAADFKPRNKHGDYDYAGPEIKQIDAKDLKLPDSKIVPKKLHVLTEWST